MGSPLLSLIRTGTLYFDADTDAAALPAHLATELRGVDAGGVEIQGNRVVFKGGVFRLVSKWNVLVPFGFGELTIDSNGRQVHYRVSCRQLVTCATAIVALLTIFTLFSPVWQPLLFMPLMWLWLVVGNLAIGIPHFERFLGRTIASTPHVKATGNPMRSR